MTDIKEIKLVDVKNNSNIINNLNSIYKLWGYEEVSPSFINTLETIKGRGVIDENQVVGIVSNNSLCLRPEMTTSIVKLSSTRLINKKRPIRLFTNGMTLNAMHPDIIVIRHQDSGACNLLSQKVNCAVLNAGDGRREHPTQALLDALTIITRKKKIQGLKIAICGDILHSRVARSNIYLLSMLGAEVNIIAPTNLMPKEIEKFGVNTFTDMKKGLKDCDIVMMLRLQNERMTSSYLSSNREYYEYYGLTPDKLEHAKSDALIMHPGPMNRGIEIDTMLADDINKSVIKEQVELGVAVRMACLKIFCT